MSEFKNKGTLVWSTLMLGDKRDTRALAIQEFIKGGRHVYKSKADCISRLTPERMTSAMQIVLREDHTVGRPHQVYYLRKLPWSKDAEPGVPVLELPEDFNGTGYTSLVITELTWDEYFSLEYKSDVLSGDYQEQWAADYPDNGTYYVGKPEYLDRKKPPFPYSADPWNDTAWSGTYDPALHKWKRYRFGEGPWSMPIPLFGNYKPGDYLDERYKWVLKISGQPETPPYQIPDGNGGWLVNNEPEGWKDLDVLPDGANIDDYNYWKIENEKNEFGYIDGPWTLSQVPIDGNLIRYSASSAPDPNTLCGTAESANAGSVADGKLNTEGWVTVPDERVHQFRAARQSNGDGTYTSWQINRVTKESGEYPDFIYREFPERFLDLILDDPSEVWPVVDGGDGLPFKPQGPTPAGWSDVKGKPRSGWIWCESECVKFFGGAQKTPWSDPTPADGQAVTLDFIESKPGNDFKYNGSGTALNTEITLEAFLNRGKRRLNTDPAETITYQWTRIYNGGGDTVLDATDDFGTAMTATIPNTAVNGKAIFQLKQTWHKPGGVTEEYISEKELTDVKDGLNSRDLRLAATAYAFMNNAGVSTPSSITLRAFEENIFDADGLFVWKRRAVDDTTAWSSITPLADTTDQLNVASTEFDGAVSEYTYRVECTDAAGTLFFAEADLQKIIIQSGSSTYTILLTNVFQYVACNSDGSVISFANISTRYQVFNNLGADVTANFTAVVTVETKELADGALTGTVNDVTVALDAAAKKISLTAWGTNIRSATIDLKLTKTDDATVVLNKDWKLQRTLGFEGVYNVDLDVSPFGEVFRAGELDPKTVKATVFFNGNPLATADYDALTIKFFDEYAGYDMSTANLWDQVALPAKGGNKREVEIGPERVDLRNNVICIVQLADGRRLMTQIAITDVSDAAEKMVLWHDGVAKPAKPTGLSWAAYQALGAAKHQGYYRNAEAYTTRWKAEKAQDAPDADWLLMQVAFEGTAGQNGGFYWPYFRISNTKPVIPSSTTNPISDSSKQPEAGGMKLSFTDSTSNLSWYASVDGQSYDPATQQIWKVSARVGFDAANRLKFLGWVNVMPDTQLKKDGKDGLNGKDGSMIHTGTNATPAASLGKASDLYFYKGGQAPFFHKASSTVWEKVLDLKGPKGEPGGGDMQASATNIATNPQGIRYLNISDMNVPNNSKSRYSRSVIFKNTNAVSRWYRVYADMGLRSDDANGENVRLELAVRKRYSTSTPTVIKKTDTVVMGNNQPHWPHIENPIEIPANTEVEVIFTVTVTAGGNCHMAAAANIYIHIL